MYICKYIHGVRMIRIEKKYKANLSHYKEVQFATFKGKQLFFFFLTTSSHGVHSSAGTTGGTTNIQTTFDLCPHVLKSQRDVRRLSTMSLSLTWQKKVLHITPMGGGGIQRSRTGIWRYSGDPLARHNVKNSEVFRFVHCRR